MSWISLATVSSSDFAAPSCWAACSPQAAALRRASVDCSTVAATAARAAATRRAAHSMALRPTLEMGAVGMLPISWPSSWDIVSPASVVPSSSSSQSCQRLRVSVSCWSATRELLWRTRCSSRASVSFSSCQYSLRTASSPIALSSHCAFSAWRWSRRTARRASSGIGSCAPPGSFCPEASMRRVLEAMPRSSSVRAPQAPCCTESQAAFTLRALLAFMASTSCLMSRTKA
mmetsp:Transcript_102323/g.289335  ORF Transcript_102323/g.289335 Transcript_102323/m.289335 type:complete len:231 (+) Transcript_102323:941-1633(+)